MELRTDKKEYISSEQFINKNEISEEWELWGTGLFFVVQVSHF